MVHALVHARTRYAVRARLIQQNLARCKRRWYAGPVTGGPPSARSQLPAARSPSASPDAHLALHIGRRSASLPAARSLSPAPYRPCPLALHIGRRSASLPAARSLSPMPPSPSHRPLLRLSPSCALHMLATPPLPFAWAVTPLRSQLRALPAMGLPLASYFFGM